MIPHFKKRSILFLPAFLIGASAFACLVPARVQITLNSVEADMSSRAFPTPEIREAVVTAYSEIDSCHHENCAMANGIRAAIGYAACPRELALGSKVRIYGEIYTCGDRTAKRYDGRFDIFMGYGPEAHRDALVFGIATTTIEVLK